MSSIRVSLVYGVQVGSGYCPLRFSLHVHTFSELLDYTKTKSNTTYTYTYYVKPIHLLLLALVSVVKGMLFELSVGMYEGLKEERPTHCNPYY